MRFERIDILRFGHLRDVRLPLAATEAGHGMHVVYGPNEAGKSTTLRAIAGLLYGIPDRTADAHTFGGDLRIAARLVDPEGRVLAVQRRKGRKNTLLDCGEPPTPLPEARLVECLAGVSEPAFQSTFGLDHVRLREGGQALLSGGGLLGDSLLSAAVGGRAVGGVLEALRQEADAIFLPRGRKPRLNAALDALRQARKRGAQEGLRADDWLEQAQVIEGLLADRRALEATRRRLSSRQRELQRAVLVLPLLAKRRELSQRFAAVLDARILPEGFPQDRQQVQRELRECEIEIRQRNDQLARLRERLSKIVVPESLVGLGEELIAQVRDGLGSHRKAAKDLPRRAESLRSQQSQIRASLRRLGLKASHADVERLRVPRAVQARVRELARSGAANDEARAKADARMGRLRDELRGVVAELAGLPDDVDATALEAALSSARRGSELQEHLQALRQEHAEWQTRLSRGLDALGLYRGDAEGLERLPLPPEETLRAFSERARAWSLRDAELRQRGDRIEEAAGRVEQQLQGLRAQGQVPTEADLGVARDRREAAYDALVEAAQGGQEIATARREFERARDDSDALVDRMRREAQQVAQQASWLAERDALAGQRATLELARAEHEAERVQDEEAYRARFEAAGIEPLPAAEMLGFYQRRAELLSLHASGEARARELADAEARMEVLRGQLGNMQDQSMDDPASAAWWTAQVERLESALAGAREAQARRQRLETARERLDAELQAAEGEATAAADAQAAWRAEWRACMKSLPLAAGATVEEVQEALDELADVLAQAHNADELQRRIDGMARDASQFERDVKRLYDRHLFELGGDLSVEEMADQLVERYHDARRDRSAREQLQEELAAVEQQLADISVRRDAARARLAELVQVAGVSEPEALEEVEQRSAERRALQAALQENLDALLQKGDGMELSEIESATTGLHADEAQAQLSDVSAERDATDVQWQELTTALAAAQEAQAQLQQRKGAADAAAEAAEALAEAREETLAYLRLRLSAHILEQEMRRHREAHQGPVLRDAGALMKRLTDGAYVGLAADYGADDEAILHCVQAGGAEVPLSSLSDGTLDQLYLALRLAALRRQSERAAPMPLVLDDILVHFDDTRARAALEVLGEFTDVTQVLFFTHHARLVELAGQVVPASRLRLHELGEVQVPAGALFADGRA